jgi:hypothetical protein
MTIGLAVGTWLLMLALFVVTVYAAILAGRGKRLWQLTPLLGLEFVCLGAAIVAWMFNVWFLAKLGIATGLPPSIALLIGLVIGVALAVCAAAAGLRLVQAAYAALGSGACFDSDFGNSLWLRRSGTWRPDETRNP